MFSQLSDRIRGKLSDGIAARGYASLVLSGGTSPLPLFDRMASWDVPWDKITITLADERWVDIEDDASNERMLRQHLLKGKAAAASFVSLKSDHPTPELGEPTCQQRVQAIRRPFDVVVLGMGNDGHTASLFPNGDNLCRALEADEQLLCSAMNAPGAPQPRITLTLPTLLACRDLILLCTGQAKQDVFKKALGKGEIAEMPIRGVLRQNKQSLAFYWAP